MDWLLDLFLSFLIDAIPMTRSHPEVPTREVVSTYRVTNDPELALTVRQEEILEP